MLNLQRFDLWAWATYTDIQKVAMVLGSIQPKLERQHEKASVLLTFSTCTQLICSIQSHSRLAWPPVPSSTSLPDTTLLSPPPDDARCQVCQSPFDKHQMFLCDICNRDGIWTASSHPLPPFQLAPANVPYVPLATPCPRQHHDTFAPSPQFSMFVCLFVQFRLWFKKKCDSLHYWIPTTIYVLTINKNCTLRHSHLKFCTTPTWWNLETFCLLISAPGIKPGAPDDWYKYQPTRPNCI